MSKIQIPIASVEIGGALQSWYYNNAMLRSDVAKSTDDTYAYATDNFDFAIADIVSILDEGGEVFEYLMAIKAPIALMSTNVPDTLPNYLKLDDTGTKVAKEFSDYLVPGVELWKKDTDDFIIFYTNPFAGNESSYLTGSEIKDIDDISPGLIDVMKIIDAQAEIAGGGWTKM